MHPISGYPFLKLADSSVPPPTTSANSVRNFPAATIAADAAATSIVVHARFPALVEAFIEYKREHGSKFEKELYGDNPESFTWRDEVARLIEKRPLAFLTESDNTLLRDGCTALYDGCREWDRNGTDEQHLNRHLTLKEYLSYDEIMLGSLLGVSGPSFFINDGNRHNRARPMPAGTFEPRGVIVGLVGARFERDDRMDATYMESPPHKSRQPVALQKIFHDFFGCPRDAKARFDVQTYKARIRITADILLREAMYQAEAQGRAVRVYVVGLGLGVWQVDGRQKERFLEAFAESIAELPPQQERKKGISTVEFAWILDPDNAAASAQQRTQLEVVSAERNIRVTFSRRNPAEKLDTGELLVLSYAWDGNAFPGNEYWQGSLSGSGDPAAACMSTIPELHNPLINPFTARIRIL